MARLNYTLLPERPSDGPIYRKGWRPMKSNAKAPSGVGAAAILAARSIHRRDVRSRILAAKRAELAPVLDTDVVMFEDDFIGFPIIGGYDPVFDGDNMEIDSEGSSRPSNPLHGNSHEVAATSDNSRPAPSDNSRPAPSDNSRSAPSDNSRPAPYDNSRPTPYDNSSSAPSDNTRPVSSEDTHGNPRERLQINLDNVPETSHSNGPLDTQVVPTDVVAINVGLGTTPQEPIIKQSILYRSADCR